ncbi:hypothetical protein CKAH01_09178 [Colletotrichum kahawae]|uniref:Uncharacterized protein n=1 Tax=Colletotrichum kahawae TaxID=34407 RepID=A0AAD9XZ48_COLKA|nr:hypothetical protein CKAH01_09178 [Colletotrichum kahawae]
MHAAPVAYLRPNLGVINQQKFAPATDKISMTGAFSMSEWDVDRRPSTVHRPLATVACPSSHLQPSSMIPSHPIPPSSTASNLSTAYDEDCDYGHGCVCRSSSASSTPFPRNWQTGTALGKRIRPLGTFGAAFTTPAIAPPGQ